MNIDKDTWTMMASERIEEILGVKKNEIAKKMKGLVDIEKEGVKNDKIEAYRKKNNVRWTSEIKNLEIRRRD